VVDNGARPNQRVVTGVLTGIAGAVAAAQLGGPAMVIVGQVVALRDNLAWFDGAAQPVAERDRRQ